MVALDISWHIFLILLLSVKVVTVVFYAHSKWQQKARKSYVRLPGSTSSAGTASQSVKFCETYQNFVLQAHSLLLVEKIPLMLRYVEEMISDD